MWRARATACWILISFAAAAGSWAEVPRVEARGLRVTGPGYGDRAGELRPFDRARGTTLALLITVQDGQIVEIAPGSLKVDGFTDDRGTDLTKGAPDPRRRPPRPEAPPVSKDGKACLVEISGPDVPARGAREIRARGRVTAKVAAGKKVARHTNVRLETGTAINAGSILCSVSTAKQGSWGGGGTMLTLRMFRRYPEIARISFYDENGEEIPSSQTGTASQSGPGVRFFERSFTLRGKVERATVEVSYWADPKDVSVGFDVTASVGM